MKRVLDYINNNVLIKVASLNSVSVVIKIIAGFLTSKFIALFVGSEGMALVGNLRNFVGSVQSISILGLYKGVVRYIAQFKNDTLQLSKTLSTVFYLGFTATMLMSFLVYFNADYINDLIFKEYNNYAYVIKIFAIALPFYALNMFSFSIMNGFAKYKYLIIFNIFGQILGAVITILLIWLEQIDGALIAVVIAESLIFLITLVGIINRKNFIPLIKASNFSFGFVKKLSSYSGMALFSAIILPLIAILIRSYIIDNVGLKEAGFWEAMNRVSKYYLLFVSTLLTMYILPRFSEIDNIKEFRKEVFSFYKTIIPIFALGLIAIYFLRHLIIQMVFTDEFKPVEELFIWQLMGDFIKVLSIVIAYQFLAKRMFWHYIITEAFSVVTLYYTSKYLIDEFGVVGANMAHFVTYIMYYAIILLIFYSSLFGVIPDKIEDQ
ncbi:O-antigen translocase [Olleya aquimaris]|uniref:PST family polysaccharide transporter n=1 Tax=Olleya aquimaris TaxID=639310 RepID=A0A327RI95_9FLAO|nr:O-antigen translocase [Olleya aquimaris]RAJ13407.1 PST family polysaccharide transporter [Olleya aquimaris]